MDDKLNNSNNNEIEDGEIFSDNDDVCEISDNSKSTTTNNNINTSKTNKFLNTVIKTNFENDNAGVNKNIMIKKKSNNRIDRKRSHETNLMSINFADENSQIFDDELNIFTRGSSPITNINQQKSYYENHSLYYDEISCDSDDNFDKYSMYDKKKLRKNKKNKNGNDKYNKHRTRGHRYKGGICGGNDNNNNDQILYKRKKLCKFFLQNKCYRPSQCVFMHGEFPCKYYYLGLKCPDDKNCKLDHGKPLNDDMKEALLRHIQYAPDECLGNFKKIPSEVADKLFADRAMEFHLNEIQLNKSKIEESYTNNNNNNENKKICDINLKDNLNGKDQSDNDKINKSKEVNFDDISIHMNKEFLNSDSYRMFLEDLKENCSLNPLRKILPIENNNIDNLPTHFNDIDERMKENLKKSIETENYDDHNFKFFMIQFFLSLNQNKSNLKLKDIPDSLNIENFREYLTEIQIGKLKELGIDFVHHLSLLSLSNLNSLGISISQISQIQDKSLTIENVTSKKDLDIIEHNKTECTEESSTSNDTDMRILPPVYSLNKWSGTNVDSDCRILSPTLDEIGNDVVLDEESDLIIDESILSDCSDDDVNWQQIDLKEENQLEENLIKDLNQTNNLEKNEKNNNIIQQMNDIQTVQKGTLLETNDYDTSEITLSPTELAFVHLIEQNMEKSINYGDMDMRFPFTPMADFLPATEINASINLHQEIEYKVNEILIPEKKPLRSSILVKLEPNHPDPRLRKEYFNREHLIINKNEFIINNIENENINNKNNNENENDKNTNANDTKITNKENLPPKEDLIINEKFKFAFIGIDPRKRFDNQSDIPTESPSLVITKNLNHLSEYNKDDKHPNSIQFLHFYLQKSHWYNDQNSKRKIEINELIAFLGKAIKDYHQSNNPNKQFNILNFFCSQKINDILRNLGIDIDCNGNIIEIDKLTNNNQHEQQYNNNNDQNNYNNDGNDFMCNNTFNFNNNNSQLYPMRLFKPPPLIPPLITIQPISSSPKPGLLGFAPGMPCNNSQLSSSSSFWCPPSSPHYYHNKNSQDLNYMVKSYNPNFQQQMYTNFFQRNHRKMNDRI